MSLAQNNLDAFLNLTAQLKSLTTRKRIAKSVLGKRHPIVAELRAEQRAIRVARTKLAEAEGISFLGQAGSRADIVMAHGVDEGTYIEELLNAAAEMGADDEGTE
jgi:hypothetical protein